MPAAQAVLVSYPEVPLIEDWDEETLRSYAVSTCANAWGVVYSQLFDGLESEGGTRWPQPRPR